VWDVRCELDGDWCRVQGDRLPVPNDLYMGFLRLLSKANLGQVVTEEAVRAARAEKTGG
jgi:hypothetical protein